MVLWSTFGSILALVTLDGAQARWYSATPVLTLDDLRTAVADGAIDSVAIVTPDLQGKLMGKRVPAGRFLAQPDRHTGEKLGSGENTHVQPNHSPNVGTSVIPMQAIATSGTAAFRPRSRLWIWRSRAHDRGHIAPAASG